MQKKFEGSLFEHHSNQTPIMFTCGQHQPYCYYGARMVYNRVDGLCIESRYPLEPGAVLYFNRANLTPTADSPNAYETHCAVVRSCRAIPGQKDIHYRIGVELVDPDDCREQTDKGSIPNAGNGGASAALAPADGVDDTNRHDRESISADVHLKTAIETAQSRARALAVLNRFATKVGSTLDLDEILQSVCREMTQVFGSRNTGIGLLDKNRTKITLVAFYTQDPYESDATKMEMCLEGNAATLRVIETGQTMVVPDVQHNPLTTSIHDIARQRRTECLMIVPLLARGEVIGTIGMPTADKNRIFTTEEVALAQTIAGQIAGALENARLYAQTEKARKIAERDLEIGQKIQTEFFPQKLPSIPGWEIAAYFQPARKVSGDFYDLFQIGAGGCLGLVVADVCDHGVGSALFMVLFRSLVRAYSEPVFKRYEKEANPGDELLGQALLTIIQRTNTYIATTHERSNMFATMFFGVLEPETGRLTYINCGHEAPLIIGAGGIETRLKATGPAVGLDEDLEFSVNSVVLDFSQTLFFYTDGAMDAQNDEGESFSKDRLTALLAQPVPSARALIGAVKAELELHIDETMLYDDVTLMAVRRTEEFNQN